MLVIADTSPFVVLINIGHIKILPTLFGAVTIPPDVAKELAMENKPAAVRDFIAQKPSWLEVKAPAVIEDIPSLHAGEKAAISLAKESKDALLLIDERRGFNAAIERKLAVTGTINVIEKAAEAKLLDLKETFERVKKTNFWIKHADLNHRLKLFEERMAIKQAEQSKHEDRLSKVVEDLQKEQQRAETQKHHKRKHGI